MKMVIIGAFDKLLNVYYPAQLIPDQTDEDIFETHRRGVITHKIDNAERLTLYKYGYFDDKTGSFDILKEPLLIIDMARFADPEKVRKLNEELKLYASVGEQPN